MYKHTYLLTYLLTMAALSQMCKRLSALHSIRSLSVFLSVSTEAKPVPLMATDHVPMGCLNMN